VTVSDNGSGQLTASVAYPNGVPPTFVNVYSPGGASATIKAKKLAVGAALADQQFEFGLYDQTGETLLQTARNCVLGNVKFDLSYDAAGVYNYKVKEISSSGGGWTTDIRVYNVTVTVTDDGNGSLTAVVSYPDGSPQPDGRPEFVNTYSGGSEPTCAAIVGMKTAVGASLAAGQFAFGLFDSSNNLVATTTNGTGGVIAFPSLAFSAAGTYNFTVRETSASGGGWTADASVFRVAVNVFDNGFGQLVAAVDYLDGAVHFVNSYSVGGGATAVITAGKTAVGAALAAGQFSFGLFDSSNAQISSATNDALGNITFPPLSFTAAGVYGFTVRETSASGGGWTTDTRVYTVTVTVTEGGAGQLTAQVAYPGGFPAFVNTFTSTGDCDTFGDPQNPAFGAGTYWGSDFAGTGVGGFNGQNGASAPPIYRPATSGEVHWPKGMTADDKGNIYIADEKNGSVRVVRPDGTMETLVGNGIENGFTPADYRGPAYGKAMYEPMAVAIAPCSEYLFFADTDSHLIRMITLATGEMRTVAGVYEGLSAGSYAENSNPLLAKFKAPQGLVMDKNGNLYIADTGNHVIRKLNMSTNTLTTIAGTPQLGGFGPNQLNNPTGLALSPDGRTLYIADTNNHVIRALDTLTNVMTVAVGTGAPSVTALTAEGVGDNGAALAASLSFPADVAVDAQGNLYIADGGNNRVRKVFKSTGVIITIVGDGYVGTGARLNHPKGVEVDVYGNVFVSDTENNLVKRFVPQV
jgi:pilin isopeptide linkage protein